MNSIDIAAKQPALRVNAWSLRSMPKFCFTSLHAIERLISRTHLTSSDLLTLLTSGRCVWLNNPERHWQDRAYLLLYSTADNGFFVVVVACDPLCDEASIVTVLTQEQYENDRGAITPDILLRALRNAGTDNEAISAFRRSHALGLSRKERSLLRRAQKKTEWRENNVVAVIDYVAASGVIDRISLPDAPGRQDPKVIDNPALLSQQPGFWQWLRGVLEHHAISVDGVVALKAALGSNTPVALAL